MHINERIDQLLPVYTVTTVARRMHTPAEEVLARKQRLKRLRKWQTAKRRAMMAGGAR